MGRFSPAALLIASRLLAYNTWLLGTGRSRMDAVSNRMPRTRPTSGSNWCSPQPLQLDACIVACCRNS